MWEISRDLCARVPIHSRHAQEHDLPPVVCMHPASASATDMAPRVLYGMMREEHVTGLACHTHRVSSSGESLVMNWLAIY
ncbi:hypothetical protein N9L68_03600 [bacterium]|nr:hypothetical protein [bacterium]